MLDIDNEKLCADYLSGMGYRCLSKKYKVSRHVVRKRILKIVPAEKIRHASPPRHPPEMIEALRRLVRRGMSSALIAQNLGLTRNTVIGLMWRNGMCSKDTRERRQPRRVIKQNRVTTPWRGHGKPLPALPLQTAAFSGVPGIARVAELEPHHCRWPISHGFCGDRRAPGTSYCARHHEASIDKPEADGYPKYDGRKVPS